MLSNLELRIRIIEGEIKENKREKEKSLSAVLGVVGCLVSLIGGSVYFFVIRKDYKLWLGLGVGLLGLFALFLGYYWYNRYKRTSAKKEELEKELARLKKEATKE